MVITELVTSGSLRDYLKLIQVPRLRVVRRWCAKILSGLAYLHDNGVIHERLSCDGIFTNSHNGDIKIGDLGLKKLIKREGNECTGFYVE